VAVIEAVIYAVNNSRPQLPNDTFDAPATTPETMSVQFASQAADGPKRIPVTVYTASWCQPCRAMKKQNGDGDERIAFTYTEDLPPATFPQNIPLCVWTMSNGKLTYLAGFVTTDQLYEIMHRPHNFPPEPQPSYSAMGQAGVIAGREPIRQVISWFRDLIGPDIPVTGTWDRSGAQTFPLLAKGNWSALAIYGRYGHFEFSATGAKNLPIDRVGFGYQVSGEDVAFDLDKVTVKGLALKLGLLPPQSSTLTTAPAPPPPKIGVLTALTIASAVKNILALLWPSVDLTLGGNVSATATLKGDVLHVDFTQGPTVRIRSLFEFNLAVKHVEISESQVFVEFSGSRWIKSRTFAVK
jgi:hypothetical protein